jgi:hypothetical protein
MKYHYHKLKAYLSFDNLYKDIKNLLAGFGTNNDINFCYSSSKNIHIKINNIYLIDDFTIYIGKKK